MTSLKCAAFLALVLLASPVLRAQATESSINKQLKALSIPATPPDASKSGASPDAQRPAVILQAAKDINSLPAGSGKLKLSDSLFRAAVAGESGAEAMQAVADTLTQTLTQSPQPEKDGAPATLYTDLAKLQRFAGAKTTLMMRPGPPVTPGQAA